MTYNSARQPEPEPRPTWPRGAERPSGGPGSSAASGAANDSNVVPITADGRVRTRGQPGRERVGSFCVGSAYFLTRAVLGVSPGR